jgi:hypothetical protein
MRHAYERKEIHTKLWKNLNEGDHLGVGVEGATILEWALKKSVGRARTGVIRFGIGTNTKTVMNLRVP